ncbi:MAG: 2-amino-4-hydroxy-6-hydroxymethyldihydropteridine diphosphokinase [Clostridia bacterium]|jgi:2-amino-4-hydroxy-6-hydroxymethyldihydropteridine diphosphokinase|nr:2-amino-4-hydroxy-6-hydroxymethyldihydropteridine diphosphokinase [Clostridia bacterium]
MNEPVYLSLGSNMGNSLDNLLQAVAKLDQKGLKVMDVSAVYWSEPVGYLEQPDFLNMVIAAETSVSPEEALDICQDIEREMGRTRTRRWGPRPIDIDILLFGERTIQSEKLAVPHPRLGERAFVLLPLQEVAPEVYTRLQAVLPAQKLVLQITSTDVKIKLQEYGLKF